MREFLCNNCNRGLGYFMDSEEVLQKAIAYLLKHRDVVSEESPVDER